MNSAKIEARTNTEFMVRPTWKNGKVIDTLPTVYRNSAPRRLAVYTWIAHCRRDKMMLKMKSTAADHPHRFARVKTITLAHDLIKED